MSVVDLQRQRPKYRVTTTNPTVDDGVLRGFQPLSLWENSVDDSVFICVDPTAAAAVWIPVGALPTKEDLAWTPSATSGNDQDSGVRLSQKPAGLGSGASGNKAILVDVNGVVAEVGDGVKTKDCFWSSSDAAPYTAKYLADLDEDDKLIWNGVVAGYDLETRFKVRLFYLSLWFLTAGVATWGSMTWASFVWGV